MTAQVLAAAHDARKAAEHLVDPEAPAHDRARHLERRSKLLRDATAAYLRALEGAPGCLGAWYGLGLCQRALGDLVASLRAFDMVLRASADGSLDGGEAPGAAWNARARSLIRVGRPVEAAASFRVALACARRPVYESNLAILEAAVRAHAEALSERSDKAVAEGPWVTPPGVDCGHLYIAASRESDDLLAKKGGARLVSAARRHALGLRHSALKKDLVAYDGEHAAVRAAAAAARPDVVPDPAVVGEPQVSVRAFGDDLRRGAEHLSRTLRIHLGGDWRLVAAERSGDFRFRVYARPRVAAAASRVQTSLVAAVIDGMAPSGGAVATAFKFETWTLALVGVNARPTGAALEAAAAGDGASSPPSSPTGAARHRPAAMERRSSWSPAGAPREGARAEPDGRGVVPVSKTRCCGRSALANRLLAATLAALKVGDERRGPSEQFSHCVVFGHLGYGAPHSGRHEDPLLGEIKCCRALAGFSCDASPRASAPDGSPTRPRSPFAAAADAGGGPLPLRVAWRSSATEFRRLTVEASSRAPVDGATCSARAALLVRVDPRPPAAYLGGADKRKMPKLVLRDVHVTYLPNSAFGAPIQAYFLLSMEPPSLLWTWMTPKLRSGISQAFPMALATMNRADGGGPVPSEDAGDGDGAGDGEGPGDGASPRAPPPLARSRSENFGARSPSPRGGRASSGPGDASPGKRPSLLLRSASTFALKTLDSFQGRRRRGRAAPAPPTGAPPRYCASWHKDQFVLRLRLRDSASKYARGRHNAVDNASDSLAAALLVVSIWAHDPHYADSLVGVAQLAPAAALNDSPHGAPAPFSQLVVLHGRAVAVLHGTLDLVTPREKEKERNSQLQRLISRPISTRFG